MKISNIFKLILKESTNDKHILFHGSMKKFDRFKKGLLFLSRLPDFAVEYAREKSAYQQADSDIWLYDVDVSAVNFFNPNKKEHIEKMEHVLPDKVNICFLYGCADFSKERVLEEMQGITTVEGFDKSKIGGMGIGDWFEHEGRPYTILKLEDDHVILMNRDSINYVLRDSTHTGYNTPISRNRRDEKFKYLFKDYFEYAEQLYRKYSKKENVNSSYHGIGAYVYSMEKQDKEKLQGLIDDQLPTLYKKLLEDDEFHKVRLDFSNKKEKTNTNYQFFESTMDYISKAGFDGHISRERYQGVSDFTFAVYDSSKVKIVDQMRVG